MMDSLTSRTTRNRLPELPGMRLHPIPRTDAYNKLGSMPSSTEAAGSSWGNTPGAAEVAVDSVLPVSR